MNAPGDQVPSVTMSFRVLAFHRIGMGSARARIASPSCMMRRNNLAYAVHFCWRVEDPAGGDAGP